MRHLIVIGSFALAGFATPGSARAMEFAVDYEASVLGVVTLGRASLRGQVTDTAYGANASVETAGLARAFEETRLSASSGGRVTGGALGWVSYALQHRYNKPGRPAKNRSVTLRRAGGGINAAINPPHGDMGARPATPAEQAASLDPVSAFVSLSRSVGGSRACTGRALVFDGKQHYALALSGGRDATLAAGGYSGAVRVCTLRYQPIAGHDMSSADMGRIPAGEAWFGVASPGGFAPMLRLDVPTPVGTARLQATRVSVR